MSTTARRRRPWREKSLDQLLRWLTWLFPVWAIASAFLAGMFDPGRLTSPLYLGAFAPLAGLFALRFLPMAYELRAQLFIGFGSVLTLLGLANFGFFPGPILGCTFCLIVSAALLGARAAVVAWLGLSIGVFVAGIPSMYFGFPLIGEALAVMGPPQWFRAAISFALFGAPLAGVIHFTVERIERQELAVVQSRYLQTLGELAGGVAHDFNNSLQLIILWSEILRGDTREPSVLEALDKIDGAVQDARQLTQQLLSMGRRSVYSPEVTSLSGLLKKWLLATERTLPEDVHLQVDIEDCGTMVLDPGLLQQVVMNLVLNARDALREGGTISVSLSSSSPPPKSVEHASGKWACLVVRDDGPGIPKKIQEQIFEPFFTTKGEDGTGLGLAIVRRVVEQHGGCIDVSSSLGKGTCFTVHLPQQPASARAHVAPSSVAKSAKQRAPLVVLLAEDEPEIRNNLAAVLRGAGHTVLLAANGDEAMDRVLSITKIDVLCTDGVMPGTPTRDVIDRYKLEHPRGGVIVCSGHVEEELVRRRLNGGEYAFLAKPFGAESLLREIDKISVPQELGA